MHHLMELSRLLTVNYEPRKAQRGWRAAASPKKDRAPTLPSNIASQQRSRA